MSKTPLLILEPDYFSQDALRILETRFQVLESTQAASSYAEVLVAGLGHQLDEGLLKNFPNLRLIASVTTGTNHIDSAYLDSRGVELVSLRSIKDDIAGVRSTAELTVGLILAAARRITQSHLSVVGPNLWDRMKFFGPELRGQKLGILGYGRIGRMVGDMAQSLGLRIHAFDPLEVAPPGLRMSPFEDVLAESDIVSIHASYSGAQILGSPEIQMMQPGAFLINTSRGELVSEAAIASAVKSGHLGGYAADVVSGENLRDWRIESDPLVTLAREGYNVTITPHLGGCTSQGFEVTQLAMARFLVSSFEPATGISR